MEIQDSASHSEKAGQSWTVVPWAHVQQTPGQESVAAMKESLVVSKRGYLVLIQYILETEDGENNKLNLSNYMFILK